MKAFDGLEVERGVLATAINIDEAGIHDPKAHAIKLTVRHLTDKELAAASTPDTIPQPGDFNYNSADEPYLKRKVAGKEGRTEVIHARFVIGADGSRSWTRSALGFDFLGDDGEEDVGGILDCIATSNFRKWHLSNQRTTLNYAHVLRSGYPDPIDDCQGRAWGGLCAKGGWIATHCSPSS